MKTIACLSILSLFVAPCAFAVEMTPYEVTCVTAPNADAATTITIGRDTKIAEVTFEDAGKAAETENYPVTKQESKDLTKRSYIGDGFALDIQVDNTTNPGVAKITFQGTDMTIGNLSCEINDFVAQ